MKRQKNVARAFLLALCAACAAAVQPASPGDPGWPRQYSDGATKLVVYQPQVDAWANFKKLTARHAVSLTINKTARPVWGVLSIAFETVVNTSSRTVALENFAVTDISYPAAKDEAEASVWRALTTKLLPAYPTTVALDRILAYMDAAPLNSRQTDVQLAPPAILVSSQPAVLVIIDGKPIPVDLEKTNLQKIVNTNWDLFFDRQGSRYYLRDDKVWLSAKELTDAWMPVDKLPKDFSQLPATESYKEVLQSSLKPQKPSIVKLVLVAGKPTELIVVAGQPALAAIAGTNLMWVTNTECDVFFDAAAKQFYFLTSGRWFRSSELKSNQWEAATTTLPEDFQKIPVNHPRAHVLSAVPGTREAEEAVLNASIPQIATIDRKSAKAEVKYAGDPKFEAIGATGVSYASNTPNDVLRSNGQYYMCLDGVWFVSKESNGPWTAADEIPEQIYSIPPSSPKYHLTFVNVYYSTADTVTYGYTAGYTGIYVGSGVAMWGTGYDYPPYYAAGSYPEYWPSSYYTYGASAWYNPATGTYRRGSAVYGPYGGYARGAAYNPATGGYCWGRPAWGAYGAAAAGGFYNPSAATWGGGYRASNGYQSWGATAVSRSDGARSRDRKGAGNSRQGHAGDFYAGKDGNVYKRDPSGHWYRNNGSTWQIVSLPSSATGEPTLTTGEPTPTTGEADRAARPGGVQAAASTGQTIQGGLDRDASARRWGNYNAQRSESAHKGGGWESGGFVGQTGTGWAIRSPGW